MAGRIIRGILQKLAPELEERLGLAARKTPGTTISGVGRVRKIRGPGGVLVRPPEPVVHPDVMTGTTPLEEMYHATNRRVPYDQPQADLNDVGLHLTRSPDIGDMFSMRYDTPDLGLVSKQRSGKGVSLAGPRMYPLLVDPGRKLKDFPVDPKDWNNPRSIVEMMDELGGAGSGDVGHVYNRLSEGENIGKILKDMNYDSAEYTISSPYSGADEHALMLLDPTRAVPQYSTTGQLLAGTRGVLAAEKSHPGTAESISSTLQDDLGFATEFRDPQHFISEMYAPTPGRISARIEEIQRAIDAGDVHPSGVPYWQAEIEKLRAQLDELR